MVLCDLGLPGMDGLEVARRLRRIPSLEQTVLLALTGYGHEEARAKWRRASTSTSAPRASMTEGRSG